MPLHVQIISVLIPASVLLCLVVGTVGALRKHLSVTLPPVPLFPGSLFPGFFVQFYTTFFIITFSAAAVAEYIAQPQPESSPDPHTLSGMLCSLAVQLALYLPLLLVYFSQPSRNNPPLPFTSTLKWLFLGLLLLLLPAQLIEASGFSQWIVEQTGCPPQQEVVDELIKGPPAIKAVLLCMAIIVAPITEECCFRGCVYNILKYWASPLPAALASAILFGAVHASLPQFLPLALFGLVQCYVYEKTRSLRLPIILHMLFNAISSVAILLTA